MFNQYLEDFINKIELNPKTLLVLKGFSIASLKKINQKYPHVLGQRNIIGEKFINIKYSEENLNTLLQEIINLKSTKFITYEEFALLNSNIVDLSKFLPSDINILILNNNATVYKPLLIEDAVKLETEDLEAETAEKFLLNDNISQGIYSSVIKQGDHLWVELVDINSDKKYKEIDLFETKGLNYKWDREEIQEIKEKKAVTFQDSSYYNLVWDLINNKDLGSHALIVLTNHYKTYGGLEREELEALKLLLDHFNIDVTFGKLPEDKLPQPRNQFKNLLSKYWGSTTFRDLKFYSRPDYNQDTFTTDQGKIIEYITIQAENAQRGGSFRDIFLTAPTGSGKSILFQLPAIYLHKEFNAVTIVISPLISLMHDQVESLNKRGVDIACYINSELSIYQKEELLNEIKEGKKSILYISPEMLLSYSIEHFIGERKIGLFVIDECHLVTTWGRDFRVDYWFLGNYITKNRKKTGQTFPILALTATAVYGGESDTVFETIESLNMRNERIFLGNVRRTNIEFDIKKHEKIEGSHHEEWKTKVTREFIEKTVSEGEKAIVYCPYKSHIRDLSNGFAGEEILDRIGVYYSDVDKDEKEFTVEDFQDGHKNVIVATKAFGMGVDISDIKYVYHYAPSGTLADYVQEIGRCARRQNITGIAKTDFNEKDLKFTKILYGLSSIKQYHTRYVLEKLYSLFLENKRQNFLVSVEDFSYIWGNARDIDNKVKSALMLIEKDLLNKFNYHVVIVRPKSLFSKGYLCVKEVRVREFENKYGKYLRKMSSIEKAQRFGGQEGYRSGPCVTRDIGPTYEVDLKDLWENKFQDISFPSLKHEFFKGSLFEGFEGDVFTRYKLTINLNEDKITTLNKMEMIFKIVGEVLFSLEGNFFSKKEFRNILNEKLRSRALSKRITDLFISIYSYNPITLYGYKPYEIGGFLQEKSTERGSQYRVKKNAIQKIVSSTIQAINGLFEDNSKEAVSYINTSGDIAEDWVMKGAFVLEAFKLGSYKLEGGREPQIFIRINYPTAVRRLAENKENYINGLIQNIYNRHIRSVEIVKEFMSEDMSQKERWDYIERYFLGKI